MPDFFSDSGLLSEFLDNFEPRFGQEEMAKAVAEVIANEEYDIYGEDGLPTRSLVVEAETGIGKTLAYLIPALLSGKRVVVSTATLNLQDQIMNKDVPLLSKVLNKDIGVVCIKGRQNYLCMYRWFQYRAAGQLFLSQDEGTLIEKWLEQTATGDRAELEWLPERSGLWPKISATSSQCLGSDCPDGHSCFITQLRKQAGSAALLVVNHHLFFSDLALRQGGYGEVLPRYEGVIFDEAHHIENVATTFFGQAFSQYQLYDLITDIDRQAEVDLDPQKRNSIVSSSLGLKQRTEEFASLFPEQRGKFHLGEFIRQFGAGGWVTEVNHLATGILRLSKELGKCKVYGDGWKTLESRAVELHDNLLIISLPVNQAEQGGYVHWYERRERSVALSATPIDVSEHLERTLYSSVEWCVMTSATLSSGGDFTYMFERLGLSKSTKTLRLSSPFDYKGRTQLYIPQTQFPEPSNPRYQEEACEKAYEILTCSRGRGLVLCTSFRGMDRMADYLEERLDYPILVQGRGSRSSLLKLFSENHESVLVAVASFWEGVDIQGESLSCVIIDKLPFEVPSDPVIKARIEMITERGGNAFFDFQVPRAILSLRQGVGRLMRAATDRGVIAILDVRLFTKGYGRRFLRSLPPSPLVRTLQPVAEFYKESDSF